MAGCVLIFESLDYIAESGYISSNQSFESYFLFFKMLLFNGILLMQVPLVQSNDIKRKHPSLRSDSGSMENSLNISVSKTIHSQGSYESAPTSISEMSFNDEVVGVLKTAKHNHNSDHQNNLNIESPVVSGDFNQPFSKQATNDDSSGFYTYFSVLLNLMLLFVFFTDS